MKRPLPPGSAARLLEAAIAAGAIAIALALILLLERCL